MSLTPERLEQIRAMRFVTSLNTAAEHFATDEERSLYRLAAEHYNARLDLLAEVDRQAKRIDQLAADRHHWMTQYHEESRTYWDAELPPGGECCAVCYQPVESEPCPDHHPATVADRLTAEIDHLRAELAARPTRAKVLEEVADTLVAACPDHGERSECRMTCACDVAAELRMDAAGHPVHEAPVLPWLPLLDDEDRDSLAVALEEEVCGGTDSVMGGLEHLLARYRRVARPASAPDVAGGAR
ncbi:hypothetical protein ACWF62_17580 [Rhodococcus sp. NPDC054953]